MCSSGDKLTCAAHLLDPLLVVVIMERNTHQIEEEMMDACVTDGFVDNYTQDPGRSITLINFAATKFLPRIGHSLYWDDASVSPLVTPSIEG